MHWEVFKPEKQPFVKVVTKGDFSSIDHLTMIEDIVTRDFWYPGMNVFFDHRNLNFGSTDIAVFRAAGENHEQNDARIGNGKAANLMKSLADFGRGRQYELITDPKVTARVGIFLDEKEAVEWLIS